MSSFGIPSVIASVLLKICNAISLGLERVEYEPEQFPGLVYRLDEPKVVVLLFGSGKLVCTGARQPSDVEEAVCKITEELRSAGLLR